MSLSFTFVNKRLDVISFTNKLKREEKIEKNREYLSFTESVTQTQTIMKMSVSNKPLDFTFKNHSMKRERNERQNLANKLQT